MGNILFGCSEVSFDSKITNNPESTVTNNPEITVTNNPEITVTNNPEITVTNNPESTVTNNFSELQAKLSKRNIASLCEYTLLLISIIIDAYDENGFYKFYGDEEGDTTRKETIEELNKELLEDIIYIDNVVPLITNLINFTSKKDKIKCWDIFEKKLSNDKKLYFIWISIKSDLEDGFCPYLDCNHIYVGPHDFHYHCSTCKIIDDNYGYCPQCDDD